MNWPKLKPSSIIPLPDDQSSVIRQHQSPSRTHWKSAASEEMSLSTLLACASRTHVTQSTLGKQSADPVHKGLVGQRVPWLTRSATLFSNQVPNHAGSISLSSITCRPGTWQDRGGRAGSTFRNMSCSKRTGEVEHVMDAAIYSRRAKATHTAGPQLAAAASTPRKFLFFVANAMHATYSA